MRRRASFIAALVATIAFAAPNAEAGTASGQLRVTATILGGCALEGGEIEFGQYIAGQANDRDAIGEIRFSDCTGTITLELDEGRNGSFSGRQMASGQNRLAYELYTNPPRNDRWGAGQQSHGKILTQVQDGKFDVYGRVFAGQRSPPGDYADTVTITMSF